MLMMVQSRCFRQYNVYYGESRFCRQYKLCVMVTVGFADSIKCVMVKVGFADRIKYVL